MRYERAITDCDNCIQERKRAITDKIIENNLFHVEIRDCKLASKDNDNYFDYIVRI